MMNTCHVKSFFHFECSEATAKARANVEDFDKRWNAYNSGAEPVIK